VYPVKPQDPIRPAVVPCPTCGKAVVWSPEAKWRPFCSERCRLIDLGEWFSEEYRVPAEEADGSPEQNTEDPGIH
jgi:uncharacterized protein